MRREHNKISGGNNIPFAENLVFYAPLTEGDLTDHVSGLVPNIQGSATWDAAKGMYLLDSTQNSQWKAALQYTKSGGFDINCQTGWTLFGAFEIYSSSWNYNAIMSCSSVYIRNNSWSSNKQCFTYMNEIMLGIGSGTIHKLAFTAKAGEWKGYVNGTHVYTGSGYTAAQQANPPTQVDICASNTNSNRIVEWAKDVRVYNRILSQQEIDEL